MRSRAGAVPSQPACRAVVAFDDAQAKHRRGITAVVPPEQEEHEDSSPVQVRRPLRQGRGRDPQRLKAVPHSSTEISDLGTQPVNALLQRFILAAGAIRAVAASGCASCCRRSASALTS